MCYVCATKAGNMILRTHFAYMAHRSGVPIQRLVDIVKSAGEEDDRVGPKDVAAFMLAHAAGSTPSAMTPTLVRLLSQWYPPAAVLELVTTVSLVHMLQRWTAVYVPLE